MVDKPVRVPGPDHPITLTTTPGRVVVSLGDQVIVDTRAALTLQEASYPAVQYLPRADARMDLLERTDHATYCPYKGDCGYFSLLPAGAAGENAVWTYEAPYPAVAAIKDYLAFYPDRVSIRIEP